MEWVVTAAAGAETELSRPYIRGAHQGENSSVIRILFLWDLPTFLKCMKSHTQIGFLLLSPYCTKRWVAYKLPPPPPPKGLDKFNHGDAVNFCLGEDWSEICGKPGGFTPKIYGPQEYYRRHSSKELGQRWSDAAPSAPFPGTHSGDERNVS